MLWLRRWLLIARAISIAKFNNGCLDKYNGESLGRRYKTYLNVASGSKLPLLVESQVKAHGGARKHQEYSKR